MEWVTFSISLYKLDVQGHQFPWWENSRVQC